MEIVLAERVEGRQPRVIPVFVLGEGLGRLQDGIPLRRRQPAAQRSSISARQGRDSSCSLRSLQAPDFKWVWLLKWLGTVVLGFRSLARSPPPQASIPGKISHAQSGRDEAVQNAKDPCR